MQNPQVKQRNPTETKPYIVALWDTGRLDIRFILCRPRNPPRLIVNGISIYLVLGMLAMKTAKKEREISTSPMLHTGTWSTFDALMSGPVTLKAMVWWITATECAMNSRQSKSCKVALWDTGRLHIRFILHRPGNPPRFIVNGISTYMALGICATYPTASSSMICDTLFQPKPTNRSSYNGILRGTMRNGSKSGAHDTCQQQNIQPTRIINTPTLNNSS